MPHDVVFEAREETQLSAGGLTAQKVTKVKHPAGPRGSRACIRRSPSLLESTADTGWEAPGRAAAPQCCETKRCSFILRTICIIGGLAVPLQNAGKEPTSTAVLPQRRDAWEKHRSPSHLAKNSPQLLATAAGRPQVLKCPDPQATDHFPWLLSSVALALFSAVPLLAHFLALLSWDPHSLSLKANSLVCRLVAQSRELLLQGSPLCFPYRFLFEMLFPSSPSHSSSVLPPFPASVTSYKSP